jgi:hypothetical protein
MNWSLILIPGVIAAGAYASAEALGQARGRRAKGFKNAAVLMSLVAGLALVVAATQFGWVTSPPGWLAACAGAVLLVQAAVAARDMATDGEPDRGCRTAVLMLPLLLVMGGSWLLDNVPRTAQSGFDKVTSRMDR